MLELQDRQSQRGGPAEDQHAGERKGQRRSESGKARGRLGHGRAQYTRTPLTELSSLTSPKTRSGDSQPILGDPMSAKVKSSQVNGCMHTVGQVGASRPPGL